MKFTAKKLPGSSLELDVSLPAEEFMPYVNRAVEEESSKVRVKGFRPGAAPHELTRKAIDAEVVFYRAATLAVRESLKDITTERSLIVLGEPKIEVLEADPGVSASGGGSPQRGTFRYRATFEVLPEVKLGGYQRIAKRVFAERREVSVLPLEVDAALEWIRKSRATATPVEREAKQGDLIDVNIESAAGGKPIEGGKLSGDRFLLGESRFMEGFDEKLIGRRGGEVVRFTLRAPDDYWNADLRGKEIDFTVKVNSVSEEHRPALDDEFARSLGPNFKDLASLKESVEKGIAAEKREKEEERLRIKVIQEIVKASAVEVPEIMVLKTLGGMVEEMFQLSGGAEKGMDREEFRKELEPRARERVAANLVIHKITEAEHLEPTSEEVEAYARSKNLDLEKHYDYSYGIVRSRKLFEFLEKSR